MKQKIERNCLRCGEKFNTWPCYVKNNGGKFCSKLCADIYKKGKPIEWTKTHGLRRHPIYSVWHSIKYRTENPKSSSYSRYGGAGIKNLWASFEEFKNDMLLSFEEHVEKYGRKNTQIDRIRSVGHYCKNNCRWVTIKEQAQNRRGKLYLIGKEKKKMGEWCNLYQADLKKVWNRVYKYRWPIKLALTT